MIRDPGTRPILPAERIAGVAIHLASLPGPYGIGDIGDSAWSFMEEMAAMGLRVWQFLPTGPTGYGDSPYQPLSAFAGNENLIGIEPLLRAGLVTPAETAELRSLARDYIDYGKLVPARNALLAGAAERFDAMAKGDLKTGYEEFLHRHDKPWLDDYALFRVIKAMHGEQAWPDWGKPYVHRERRALLGVRDKYRASAQRVKFLQFLFDRQWRMLHARAKSLDIILFADMPIYMALDSADAWARPELLRIDADGRPSHVSGVPPDYFSESGQLWGNPLYDWDYHARDGYRWWISRLRHAAELADLVRIDHFRGFEAFWAVPAESRTARNGAWEKGPGKALFDAMHGALGHLPIVAEDLGVITPAVDALRQRHRIPGMAVLQFAVSEPGFDIDDIEANCVCYTGTHDNDTTVGWFEGGDDDTRTRDEVRETRRAALRLTRGSKQTIHADMIALAFSSKARIAIAPVQDFLGLGSEARLNIPGTTSNNWRWRLQPGQLTTESRESIRKLIRDSSREQAFRLN